MRAPSLRTLAIAAVAVLVTGYALAFFWAPLEAEGFIQKIFYLHVPLAVIALLGFLVAAVHSIRHLRTGDPIHDARSYVSIHLSVIFGVGALLTGAIWAKGQWGVWWEWREPTLVSFLIVFLLYATYYPLRYSIEDRERQGRYASVFAITAGAFIPLNFMAVRLADPFIHPRTFSSAGGLPGEMLVAFLVCLAGMGLLWTALVRFELAAKGASADLGRLRRALEPTEANRPAPEGRSPRSGSPRRRWLAARPEHRGGADGPARARAGRVLRGRRLPRLRRPAVDLRRDHGRQDPANPAHPAGACGNRRARAEETMSGLLGAGGLPPDRAAGASRAPRPDRGPRDRRSERARLRGADQRGGRDLDLQPDRALPRRQRRRRGRDAALGVLSREAGIRPTELLGPLYLAPRHRRRRATSSGSRPASTR